MKNTYQIETEPTTQELRHALQFLSGVAEFKTPEGKQRLAVLHHAIESDYQHHYFSETLCDLDWKVENLSAQWNMLKLLLTAKVIEYPHIHIGGYNDFNCRKFDASGAQPIITFSFLGFRFRHLHRICRGHPPKPNHNRRNPIGIKRSSI